MSKIFDLFIIGGGINGAGIARDAAGRGLSVCLADKGEIGGATSSWSTKLIHGGLRYLENYEFKLVRESLKEREIILSLRALEKQDEKSALKDNAIKNKEIEEASKSNIGDLIKAEMQDPNKEDE